MMGEHVLDETAPAAAAEPVYLDANATTPVAPDVLAAMLPYFTDAFGNPSSPYAAGTRAKAAIGAARAQVAALIGADEAEIVFTSGGTEGANTAIRAALEASPKRRVLVTTAVEHAAVRSLTDRLESQGFMVRRVPVESTGALDMAAFEDALDPDVAVVSAMWANNETGTLFPVAELAEKARSVGALFHTDAVQAVGKLPIDVASTLIDLLSFSGHKLHGPKGIGALYVRRGLKLAPLIAGGRQERGRRGGTENVPGIVGLGVAAERAAGADWSRIQALRDRLEAELTARVTATMVLGDRAARLANTSCIAFAGADAEAVLHRLDRAGIAAASGAACSSGSIEPSHVLRAMAVPDTFARGAIRLSLSRDTTGAAIDRVLAVLPDIVADLRPPCRRPTASPEKLNA
jgi:cysteine desulfurase